VQKTICYWVLFVGITGSSAPIQAERERFETPNNGPNLGVWRITNDPTVRVWANYHNTQCWSPDGRYLCYTRYGYQEVRGRMREHTTVHLYDLGDDREQLVGVGHSPRWANRSNLLLYVHEDQTAGPSYA